MKILMAYEHYPCSIARFWKRAFERLGCSVHTMGHCTGGKIGWGDHHDLSRWTDRPDIEIANFSNIYYVGDATMAIAREYDLFINVDAAHHWVGKLPIPKVIIGTDPHCIDYNRQRDDSDLFVCMQKYYSKPSDLWIPYAYDPLWHHRPTNCPPDNHAVTFWGVEYPERTRDLDSLARAGFGLQRGTGRVFDECAESYSTAPLAYCRPSLLDLPARFFEAMAHGALPLITSIPELALFPEFVPGVHYVLFEEGNLVEAARSALTDPNLPERRRLALAAVKEHTWDNRAAQLLVECKRRKLI